MNQTSISDDTVPIVCTLTSDEIPTRVDLITVLRSTLTAIDRTETGLLLRFPLSADIEADVRRFAIDEQRCCRFWGFALDADTELTLRWDGPPETAELLDRFLDYFRGDQPLATVSGLL